MQIIFTVIGIHLLVGSVLYVFAKRDSRPLLHQISWEKKICLIVNNHPAATSLFSSPEKNFNKYWISGSSLGNLTKNIEDFSSIEKGQATVVLIGLNDSADNEADEEDSQTFFSKLPVIAPIICFAVPPVANRIETKRNNAKISEYNRKIKKACADQENCKKCIFDRTVCRSRRQFEI